MNVDSLSSMGNLTQMELVPQRQEGLLACGAVFTVPSMPWTWAELGVLR